MKITRAFIVGGLAAALPVWAIYAPIPEQEQGKEWTFSVRAGVGYDSNIFGAKTGAISSSVMTIAPKVVFNSPVDDQTFATASYALTVDHFSDRPGEKTLDSHDLVLRLAHSFSQATTLDLRNEYLIAANPESALNGITVNTDQSYKLNRFDGKYETSVAPQTGAGIKFRSLFYRYDNSSLGNSLDRTENLFGIFSNYDMSQGLKAAGEYRHEEIQYKSDGPHKDKRSDFLIGGFDYAVAKQLSATVRLGFEWRNRASEPDLRSPYVELTAKYLYAPRSFFSAGFVDTLRETSNPQLYNDERVNSYFFNLQHAVSASVVVSGTITYEPSQLEGRTGHPSVDEDTTRFGLALTYLPTKNWTVTGSVDYDNIVSGDPNRGQTRNRWGLNASYSF
jgi:predicted porin